jgi:hypothetical protein
MRYQQRLETVERAITRLRCWQNPIPDSDISDTCIFFGKPTDECRILPTGAGILDGYCRCSPRRSWGSYPRKTDYLSSRSEHDNELNYKRCALMTWTSVAPFMLTLSRLPAITTTDIAPNQLSRLLGLYTRSMLRPPTWNVFGAVIRPNATSSVSALLS